MKDLTLKETIVLSAIFLIMGIFVYPHPAYILPVFLGLFVLFLRALGKFLDYYSQDSSQEATE